MKTKCAVPTCDQPFPFHALTCPVIAGPITGNRDAVVLLITAVGLGWEILKIKALRLTGNWRPEHVAIAQRVVDQSTVAIATVDRTLKERRGE